MMRDSIGVQILETVPFVMHSLRKKISKQQKSKFTIEEFRVMVYVARNPGRDLSSVAGRVGLSLPSVSKIVDSLIKRKIIVRAESGLDRRRLVLNLSEEGVNHMKKANRSAMACMGRKLTRLKPNQKRDIGRGLKILRSVFSEAR